MSSGYIYGTLWLGEVEGEKPQQRDIMRTLSNSKITVTL